MVATAAVAQYGLGLLTLLNMVPVSLGVAHQSGALTLLSTLLWMLHSIGPARVKVVSSVAKAAAKKVLDVKKL